MNVIVSNNIRIENPTENIRKWCDEHLILPNPEYSKKVRMGFWVGNTPKTVSLYEKHGNTIILPFGILRKLPINNMEYINAFSRSDNIDYGKLDMGLYDYQKKAVDRVYSSHYGILQAPAGSGKTQIGIALIKRFRKRTLWLTHTVDLLKQSKDRAGQYIDPGLIGTITGGKINMGTGVTFATIQTMSKLDLQKYKNMFDVVIVDECHRVASSPTAVTMFGKVLSNLSARHKIGLSATVHRSDGLIKATYALLGDVVYTVPQEDVEGRIEQVGIFPIDTKIGVGRECQNTDGTLNYTKLISYLCENVDRNLVILNSILENSDKSCLILSDRLNHLDYLMKSLPDNIRNQAVMISGRLTSAKDKISRGLAIEDMRAGHKKLLFATYSLAREGLDIPCLERLFLTTPIKDKSVVIQSIGRVARTCDGKNKPIAIDFIDRIRYCENAFKDRIKHYKKINCYMVERIE